MDEAGKKRLLEEYAANKRPETREQLILEYAPLVKVVAGRLSMYLGYNVDYEDLVSYPQDGLDSPNHPTETEKNRGSHQGSGTDYRTKRYR